MALFKARSAGAVGSEETGQACEGFVKLVWIAQSDFEETELMVAGAAGFGGECE